MVHIRSSHRGLTRARERAGPGTGPRILLWRDWEEEKSLQRDCQGGQCGRGWSVWTQDGHGDTVQSVETQGSQWGHRAVKKDGSRGTWCLKGESGGGSGHEALICRHIKDMGTGWPWSPHSRGQWCCEHHTQMVDSKKLWQEKFQLSQLAVKMAAATPHPENCPHIRERSCLREWQCCPH